MKETSPHKRGQSSPGETSLRSETDRILTHLKHKFGLELMPITLIPLKRKYCRKGAGITLYYRV